jgi:hypothetical protein
VLVIALASLALAAKGDPAPDSPDEPTADESPAGDEAGKPPRDGPPAFLDERTTPSGVRVSLRGVAEAWHDPYLATRFKSGGIGAGFGVHVPIIGPLAVDGEIAYQRVGSGGGGGGGDAALQLMPVSALATFVWAPDEDGGLQLFAGTGPAMVMWTESGQDEEFMRSIAEDPEAPVPTVLRGARPALEVRIGGRIDLGLVDDSLAPIPQGPVRAVELEIFGARRLATTSAGFNLNTWRAGAGVALRF